MDAISENGRFGLSLSTTKTKARWIIITTWKKLHLSSNFVDADTKNDTTKGLIELVKKAYSTKVGINMIRQESFVPFCD
jgi:hypothetical protein